MRKVWLSELVSRLEGVRAYNLTDARVCGITYDSRRVRRGYIFAALGGENHSPSDYISDAILRGAVGVLTDDLLIAMSIQNAIKCDNARKTMAEISKLLYADEIDDMRIIAVTGTKGKTTTSLCLYNILKSCGLGSVLIGTNGMLIDEPSVALIDSFNTTPESPELYRALSVAYRRGIRVAIVEVSSQALTKYRIHGLPVTVAVFTNFSEDHIGNREHASIRDYFLAKRTLFTSYGARIAVLNASAKESRFIAKGVPRRLFVTCKKLGTDGSLRTRFLYGGEEFTVCGGGYNAENAALAIAAAELISGIPRRLYARALADFRAEGRFETYTLYGKLAVIDYAHNEQSVRALLSDLRSRVEGRIICVFGSVGMRTLGRRAALAKAAEQYADISILTADNPDFEPAEKICEEIFLHFRDKRRALIVTDRAYAIAKAVSLAHRGDTVVLLGKGHERFQLTEGRRVPFSERAILFALGAKRN